MKYTLPWLMLKSVVCLLSVGVTGGCTTQPGPGEPMPDAQYRYLYPRQEYNSSGPWEQRDLDDRAMREALEKQRR